MVNKISKIIKALSKNPEKFCVELHRYEIDSSVALPESFNGRALCITLVGLPKILLDVNALTFVGGKKASLSSWGIIYENFMRVKMSKKDAFILNVPKVDIKLPSEVGVKILLSNGKSFQFKPSKDTSIDTLEGELNDAIVVHSGEKQKIK